MPGNDPTRDDAAEYADQASISFRQIRLFEATGRLGSITRAAKECRLSQPAATQSLAVLQRKAGITLLEGRARGTTLTAPGAELHASLSLMLRTLDRSLRALAVADSEAVVWNLSQNQIRLLDAIRERGSLEDAAIALGITARSAQRAARALETLLDCPLLIRAGRGTVLTDMGEELARQIGLLVAEIDWIIVGARHHAERAHRTIVIGVAPDPGTAGLSGVIKAHADRYPHACIELIEAGQKDLLARLVIGEVDFVVGHIPGDADDRIAWTPIADAAYRIVGRAGHPLTRKSVAGIADLLRQNWVLGARGSQRRAASDALFAGHAPPACSLVTSAAPLMAQMLADSDRLGLMTDHELAPRRATLAIIAHEQAETVASIGWASRAGWQPSTAHQDLIDIVASRFAP